MTRKKIIQMVLGLILVLVLGIGGFIRSQSVTNPAMGGETMGTGYSIIITGKLKESQLKEISTQVIKTLADVNKQMSTWDPESEISRFNHARSVEPFPCSEEFAMVVGSALELSRKTKGAFDPTLQPLLNLWGFGSEAGESNIPDDETIAVIKEITGWDKIKVSSSDSLQKTEPEVSLALGAIAKGYGVDVVAGILDQAGLENWFVEIGGEVVARGVNSSGVPWKIGIQFPTTNPMDMSLQGIVHVSHGAIATSGDYRNYREEDGVVYSHILDPRTGKTVRSSTASVTVSAPDCMLADGTATALFVMGPEEGLAWVEQTEHVEALFLIRTDTGEIIEKFSSGFKESTGYTPSL
ncbi:FAD:protein FMN transferase [Pontiellaceae bacterium B12227]|nr:FAD:protein FMN transferase [Pontiellaceae bacterium B12227]